MNRTALIIAALIIASHAASAAGLGLSPSIFTQDDLARGIAYEQHLKILNLNEGTQSALISAHGEAADWIAFVDENDDEITGAVTIPGKGEYPFRALINVPEDAPNGEYRGTIDVTPIAETNNSATVIVQGVYMLEVSGAQTRSARLESITVTDSESGQLVRFRYDVRNTGNVEVTTRARADIERDGAIIGSVEAESEPLRAGTFSTQEVTWNSENHGIGNLTATVSVFLDGVKLGEREVGFELLPRGTYSAEAMAGSIETPDDWEANTIGKITVPVYNTGGIDVLAKVTSEASRDGKLIEVLSSDEKLIPAGKSERIEYYFTPERAGSYDLSGKVVYNGKELALEPIIVRVSEPDTVNADSFDAPDRSRYVLFGTLLIVAGLVAVIAIMGWQMSKR